MTTEPSFVAIGPFHIAYGVNDRVWIHELGEIGNDAIIISQIEGNDHYIATHNTICMYMHTIINILWKL